MADVIRPAAVEEGSPIQNGQSALPLYISKLADWLGDNTVALQLA